MENFKGEEVRTKKRLGTPALHRKIPAVEKFVPLPRNRIQQTMRSESGDRIPVPVD
jgi:hypothetical protein